MEKSKLNWESGLGFSLGPIEGVEATIRTRVLITGSKGFVGTETKNILREYGHTIIEYDLMDGNDIMDIENLRDVVYVTRPERILHLAAIARFEEAEANPILAHETNILGTINVAKVAKECHIPVVHASTGSVYMPVKQEPPITENFPISGNSIYGCTKAIGESYIRQNNPYIVLRYAHLYGKEKRYHGLIGNFIGRIEKGLKPELYGGKQSNDFCYIKDVARANYLALFADWDKWNNVYNIGSGEELTAEKAGRILCKELGHSGEMEIIERREVDPQRFVYDVSKAERMLKFRAEYNFKKGLKDMNIGGECVKRIDSVDTKNKAVS